MLVLSVLPIQLAIIRLEPSSPIPLWGIEESEFFSITKTKDELSVVCREEKVPSNLKAEKGGQCFKVNGPLDFGLTGILSSLISPLAKAKISIFAISTFDTDYILVKKENLESAIATLSSFCKIVQ